AVERRRLTTPMERAPRAPATAFAWKSAIAPAPMKPNPRGWLMSMSERNRIVAIYRVAERLVQLHPVERAHLREQHGDEVVLRVHPEQRAGRAIPEELPDRAR